MNTILECSKRTITKIASRLNLSCFECGWGECVCDWHHILPTSRGGKDDMSNLTYLCPNCHRKAHKGLLHEFKTGEEVIGETWKDHYNVTPRHKSRREFKGKVTVKMKTALANANAVRSKKSREIAIEKIAQLRAANLDYTKYGWIEEASKILNIAPQSVRRYLRLHAADILVGTKIRQKNF